MNQTAHHAHRHSAAGRPDDPGLTRMLRLAVIACGMAIVVGAVLMWPSRVRTSDPAGLAADPIDASVTAVEQGPCASAPTETCTTITFRLDNGDAGSFEQGATTRIDVGDGIRVTRTDIADGQTLYSFYDFQRSTPLLWLAVLFAGAVVALGRWRGLGALVGLAASLGIIVWFALPALVDGHNAVAVALVTSGAVAIVALYLAHGVNAATDVALLSTLASLALTGLLAWLFVHVARLTGYTDDASFVLDALGTGVDPRGILLAGIVIGSIGLVASVPISTLLAVRVAALVFHAERAGATCP